VTAYPHLFSPLDLGGVRLRNRVAHASVVTRFVANGQASENLINYIGSRARGGAGMIVTEPVAMITANKDPYRLRAYDDGGMDSLQRVAAAAEEHDCRLLGQVQDPGRGRHELGRNDGAIGVSALPDDLSWTVPHVLSESDIRRAIEQWAAGSKRLQKAGFSGVELSAGHGHLLHQFLSPWSNRRDDAYGGDEERRTQFLRELITAIRAECGRPFIIGVKLPADDGVPHSIDLELARDIAGRLAATGEIDFWSWCWGAHANSLWTHLPDAHGQRAPYMRTIHELAQVDPSIATCTLGYMTDPNEGEYAVANGLADFIQMGRALITDPAWPMKAEAGRESEIRYCVSCNTCWRSIVDGRRLECDNNPRVAAPDEADWQVPRTDNPRRVVVVGSGIAGLETAWVAAARGHDVTVLGQSDEVGGKLRLHAELPGGENLSSIYDYQYLAGKRHGVDYRLGAPATADSVVALQPDVVVLATGATLTAPAFVPAEYIEEGFVLDLRTLMADLAGRTQQEEGRLVLVDCDHTEMTYAAAERLTELFTHVTIVTPRDRLASDCTLVNRQQIYQRLHDRFVDIVTCCEPRNMDDLEDAQLKVYNVYNGAETVLDDVVAVTYATSRAPVDALRETLQAAGCEVVSVGDCHAPRSVLAATREGYRTAMEL
jgi:2,4-dienoyl-CoA reductase-like NADH-dependent reductase (Old Yellow Enzyme family)